MMKSAGESIKTTTWAKKRMKAASTGITRTTKIISGSSFVPDLASKGYQSCSPKNIITKLDTKISVWYPLSKSNCPSIQRQLYRRDLDFDFDNFDLGKTFDIKPKDKKGKPTTKATTTTKPVETTLAVTTPKPVADIIGENLV